MKAKYLGETDPVALIHGKVYEVLGEEKGYYRVIDEEEEDYLYHKDIFEIVEE